MGISGLLQGIKSYSTVRNIHEWEGQCVAVDASGWLHKAVYSIADHYVEMAEKNRIDDKCINTAARYMTKRCKELIEFAKIKKIYMVMDGKRCPMKAVTNLDRDNRRSQNLAEARRLHASKQANKAFEKYKACIKVKDELSVAVMRSLAKHFSKDKLEIVWSPYEADPMLVKLAVDGFVHAIITEDSDVLVYAATCNTSVPILFKFNRDNGRCEVLSASQLMAPQAESLIEAPGGGGPSSNKASKNGGLSPFLKIFAGRNDRTRPMGVRLFVQACVLSGCDYAPNQLGRVGTVTAFRHIRNTIHRKTHERFRHALKQAGGFTEDYEALLSKSESVFYYHPVRDLKTGTIVYLNQPTNEPESEELPCLVRFGTEVESFLGTTQDIPIPALLTTAATPFFSTRSKPPGSNPYRKRSGQNVSTQQQKKRAKPTPLDKFLCKAKETQPKHTKPINLWDTVGGSTSANFLVSRRFPTNGARTRDIKAPALQKPAQSRGGSGTSFQQIRTARSTDMIVEKKKAKPATGKSMTSRFFPSSARRVTLETLPPSPDDDGSVSSLDEVASPERKDDIQVLRTKPRCVQKLRDEPLVVNLIDKPIMTRPESYKQSPSLRPSSHQVNPSFSTGVRRESSSRFPLHRMPGHQLVSSHLKLLTTSLDPPPAFNSLAIQPPEKTVVDANETRMLKVLHDSFDLTEHPY